MKTKKRFLSLFAVFLIAIAGLFIALFHSRMQVASAATTPKYSVAFDYSASYVYGSGGGSSTYPSSGTNVYSASFRYGANKTTYTLSVSMYGSSASGTGTFVNGGFIDSTEITVEVTCSISMTVKITDSSGTSVGSGTNSVSVSGLSEDTYTVSISGGGGGTINSRAGWSCSFKGTFEFQIDGTAPTISGASTSATGKYANAAFTVTASDSGSGVKAVYMRAPDSSTFYSAGTSSATVNSGSTNGRYTFYAEDKAGNKSGYYYVNFDDTLPVLTCTGATFGSSANGGFTVTASDNSGSVTLYYKIGDGIWTASGSSSYTVSDSADDGTYYFYAADNYGNQTDAEWVQVGAELYGEFVKSDTDNAVYFTWERSSWTATLDGDPYVKNTWITAEGEHTVKLSSATKTAVYTYTIDHNYVEQYSAATCTAEGALSYSCTQCGASYVAYSLEETGHYYVASTVAATCTTGGYTVYTCTRCGDSYTDNYTQPLGHNYSETYKAASCTEYGRTVFTCQICGDSYSEYDGTYPTGHNYTVTVVTSPTCTTEGLLRSICDDCGDTYDTVIAANGHNYTITSVTSDGGITTRTYVCMECGESYTQEIRDQYEEVANYVEYLFDAYSPYMWWVLLAAAGIWSIVIGMMIAIARKNEDKEKVRKMLINYAIGLVVIAIILFACPYLIRGIATLVT